MIYLLIWVSGILILLWIFGSKMNKRFYTIDDTGFPLPKLSSLRQEILNICSNKAWIDWPESNLYEHDGTWKIIPFYGFDMWVDKNCSKCPQLTQYLKQIPGLRLATLSKMSPGMKLTPHQGWGNYSNFVLRCHYGVVVPPNKCYISVSDDRGEERQFHQEDEWLIFDDSKTHFAENMSDEDRIVLIIDIDRPSHIEPGISQMGDTKELIDFVEKMKIDMGL